MREVCHPIEWSLLGLLKKALGLCVKGGGEEEWVVSSEWWRRDGRGVDAIKCR